MAHGTNPPPTTNYAASEIFRTEDTIFNLISA